VPWKDRLPDSETRKTGSPACFANAFGGQMSAEEQMSLLYVRCLASARSLSGHLHNVWNGSIRSRDGARIMAGIDFLLFVTSCVPFRFTLVVVRLSCLVVCSYWLLLSPLRMACWRIVA
jgi:hypothetical protein